MIIQVKNYAHKIGRHCISSALMNYLTFNGFPMSEGMAFGLDASLGFCYKKYDAYEKIPPFYTGGRTYSWIDNICKVMEIKHTRAIYQDGNKAWGEIMKRLKANQPVMVELDKSRLSYWKGVVREVPFHMVLVVGFDDETNEVLIADVHEERIESCRQEDLLHRVSFESFQEARTGKFQWGNIDHAIHTFEIPDGYRMDIKKNIVEAIKMNVIDYLENSAAVLEQFRNEIGCWAEMLPHSIYSEEKKRNVSPLRYQVMITGKMCDEVGTGGGNFRTLYSEFLDEASSLFEDNKSLKTASELMKTSSECWVNFANKLEKACFKKEISEIDEELKQSRTIIDQCLELEMEAFQLLNKWSI